MKQNNLDHWLDTHLGKWQESKKPAFEFLYSAMPSICNAVDDSFSQPLLGALNQLILKSENLTQDFKIIDVECQKGSFSIFEVLAELAEMALRYNLGRHWQSTIGKLADGTGFAGLRFLSAWICLNNSDLAACLVECDKVEQPYAAILALQGQALLENGEPESAIATLQGACQLAPNDSMIYFQLAKAYHVINKNNLAWEALEKCSHLSRNNPEILVFQAMVAMAQPTSHTRLALAFEQLMPELQKQKSNASLFELMSALSFNLEEASRFEFILKTGQWSELILDQDFQKKISWYLREFERLEWRDLATLFLDKIVSHQQK